MVQSILHKCMFLFPYKEWNVQNKKLARNGSSVLLKTV